MNLHLLESLKTGHAVIDADHAEIITVINEINGLAKLEGELPQILPQLDHFVSLCEIHFCKEERVLADAGYPYLNDHKTYHRQMLVAAGVARQHFCESPTRDSRLKCLEQIVQFMVEDILGSDMSFVSFCKRRGLAHERH